MRNSVTEERLRADVERAEAELDQSREKYVEMMRLGRGQPTLSDGTITLSEARLLHADARRRLERALARFCSFVF
jgi:hypothetical protein